jgi:hypothetical protein
MVRPSQPADERPNPSLEIRLTAALGSHLAQYAGRVRLVALLFAQPGSQLYQKEIVPRLEYWHHRSGRRFDFLTVGIGGSGKFDGPLFAASVAWLEARSAWKYSGETDIVLLNASVSRRPARLILDTRDVVGFSVEAAIADGAFRSLGQFVERVCQFAERYRGNDPTWGFSNAEAGVLGATGLKAILLSALPTSLRKPARAAFHLRVKSFRKGRT